MTTFLYLLVCIWYDFRKASPSLLFNNILLTCIFLATLLQMIFIKNIFDCVLERRYFSFVKCLRHYVKDKCLFLSDFPDWRHFPESHVIDGEPETVVSASLQKIKSIKNQHKLFKIIFYFIKSQTCDSFVSHFDGHFAYLKTLDFSFKRKKAASVGSE